MYKLVISDDEGKTIIVPLVRDLITVGRQDGNTIRLTERNVSRQHARFSRDDKGNYHIEDLGSYNGISLNGVKIEKKAELKDGDRVGIGDYVIALRAESAAAQTRPSAARRSSVPSGFGVTPPARLVMLSSPAPGAEFSISKPEVTIGRLEELDLCISHRSISREHARVGQNAGAFEIEDQRSANGVRVNGHAVKKSPLRSGDIVELGQVRFRFVGPGEPYVFDPSEEQHAFVAASSRGGPHRGAVFGLIALAAVGGGVLAVLHDGSRQAGAAMREDDPGATPPPNAEPLPSTQAMAVDHEKLATALKGCDDALRDGRPSDALAAAETGLALPGSGDDLASCKRRATDSMRAHDAYEQGARALAENKLEDAYFLFAGIPDDHAYRERPEVKTTIQRVAEDRLARARKQVKTAPGEARNLASSVLDMRDVPASLREEAERMVESTGSRPAPSGAAPALVATKPARGASSEPAAEDAEDPAKVARTCLARGDQRCVVKALEGKAESAQELALLIETYRALGETKKAVKHMETFVSRFATARQTPQYRQFIAKHEQ